MKSFRSEINGLRAVAVLAVLLFHAQVPGFSGGFIGVDIFFVISGFLMTQIIIGGLGRGDFSLLGFWAARARRIVPALLALCMALAVLGWFLIDPITYLGIGNHVAASLAFVSNIAFWRESGYFDQAAEAKWLLHTWSLSLEWQFYLLYPIALIGAHHLVKRRAPVAMLWLGFIVSLLLSMVVTAWRPSMAFYLLPTRAWEMIAGGLVFIYGSQVTRLPASGRRGLEILGLALIVGSLAMFKPVTPWPSGWALVPVAGTMAVIFSDRRGASILNLRALQALGLCSYSVYLWHWPIIVAFRYYEWASSTWAVPMEIGLSLGFGIASFRLVERPSQAWLSQASIRRIAAVALPAFAAMAVWSAADIHDDGFIGRSRQPGLMADYVSARSDWDFPEQTCARGGRDRSIHVCRLGTGQDTLVIGDSHANQWFVRAADHKDDATFVTRDGCPPLPGVDPGPGADCPDFYRFAMETAVAGHYRRVVFASFWQSYLRPAAFKAGLCVNYSGRCVVPEFRPEVIQAVFTNFAQDLKTIRPGTEIVLVLPDLEPPGDLPVLMAKRLFFGRDASDLVEDPVSSVRAGTERLRMALQKVALEVGGKTIDPLDAECGPVECRYVDSLNRPLFRDSNHLRSSVVRSSLDFLDPYLGGKAVTAPTEGTATNDPEPALALKSTQP